MKRLSFLFTLLLVLFFTVPAFSRGQNRNVWMLDANGTPYGQRHEVSAFGELITVNPSPVFQGTFEYTVSNTDLIENTVVDGGTVTQATGMAVLTSSTTTASTAMLISKHHAKYRSGQGGMSRFTALFTTGTAGTEQFIGLMDEAGSSEAFKNGYGVGYDGAVFGIHRWQNDTLTTVAQANWNDPLDGTGDSKMTLDQTKLNVFQIKFQYLGSGAITFAIEDDSTGHFVIFHTILYANLNTTPSVYNPNFHHTIWVNNGATTDNVILKSASYAYFVEGVTNYREIHQPQFSSANQSTASITTELAIFTIRSKATYASKTNFVDVLIENITASIEASSANNLGNIRLVKNATLGGTPSYADINATNSTVEIDTAGTTVTGGSELFTIPLAGKNDKYIQDISGLTIILRDGDSLTLSGTSANSATIEGSLLWKELF